MIPVVDETLANNHHAIKSNNCNQMLSNTKMNFDNEDEDDETTRLVSIQIDSNEQIQLAEQQTTMTTLRSILRKQTKKNMSIDESSSLGGQNSIAKEKNVIEHVENDDDERDSDYTGDENDEEESNGNSKSRKEESKNNEQRHQHCGNYSLHQQRDQFFRTSPSTPFVLPLETEVTGTRTRTSSSSVKGFDGSDDQSPTRAACVTFTKDQPTVIHRSSSTPQLTGIEIQPRSSITYINMKEDISISIPITTTTSSAATLGAEFRPVYVSPLKYRPLVGLSATDNRLLLEKRVSLLGKPLIFHPIQKRSQSYRRTQLRIYNFLERPHGCKAVFYHTFVFFTVFLCLFLSVVVTMPDYESIASTVLLQTEILVVIWLAIELALRVWSAGCRSRYQTLMGRLRFMKKPFCALDFTVIVATVITLCLNSRGGNGVFAASALRGLRFFQILRMLRMDRRGGTWKLLGSVVYAHRQELITTIYIGFLVLIFSSFIMFLVEKDSVIDTKGANNLTILMTANSISTLIDTDRHKFETFADALWWGIITLCTVGYGDKVPSTNFGKLIAAVCSFIGISFFALPAGILGSGFALKVQQQQRQKHYKRRKIPAVLLIQNLWRVYAADEKSSSKATWKVHVRPPRPDTNVSITSQSNPHPVSFSSFRMRNNQSFLNRVSFRRRTPTRETASTILNLSNSNDNTLVKPPSNPTVAAMRTCIDTLSETATITPSTSMNVPHEASSSDNEDDRAYFANDVASLTPAHRNAIRFVRKVKYFVSRRKFREALRPYDVTDVIEQYSTGNVDMLARMKYLQARLDKVLGTSKSLDSYESGPSLASRICKIERQVDTLDLKVEKLCQLATSLLDHSNHRQASSTSTIAPSPPPTIPLVRNRYGIGSHYRFSRRRHQRPRVHQQTTTTTMPSAQCVMRTNSTQTSVLPHLPPRERSRDSLVSLYWLFQDNINSSRT